MSPINKQVTSIAHLQQVSVGDKILGKFFSLDYALFACETFDITRTLSASVN